MQVQFAILLIHTLEMIAVSIFSLLLINCTHGSGLKKFYPLQEGIKSANNRKGSIQFLSTDKKDNFLHGMDDGLLVFGFKNGAPKITYSTF